MRISLFSLVLFFIVFSVTAQVAELPEPVAPTIDYVFQIAFGSKTALTWTDVVPTSLTVTAGVVNEVHNYYGRIGINTFRSVAMDSTTALPTIVIAGFDIQTLPNNRWFDIFRIRDKAVINHPDGTKIESVWSEPSFWVLIIDMRKLGNPIGNK